MDLFSKCSDEFIEVNSLLDTQKEIILLCVQKRRGIYLGSRR